MLTVMDHFCPSCSGEPYALGTLGRLLWMRCRDCGDTFSANVNDNEEEQDQ